MKIVSVKIHRLRVAKKVGELEVAWDPGSKFEFKIGGGNVIEIGTDVGLSGIGPDIDERFLDKIRELLIGKDPFDVEHLNAVLGYYCQYGTHYQHIGAVDIALWDLIGKANELPLYKLWGASSSPKVTPYAAMARLSTPEERAEMAISLCEQNWQAIKLRLHHERMEDDIRTVELVRNAVGSKMDIMVDANQAQSKGGWQPGIIWDYERALYTSRAMEEMGCLWVEEPLPRYSLDEMSRLNQDVSVAIAGGENLDSVHEFENLCKGNCVDILQPECLVVNGITAMRKIGELSKLYGKKIVPHNGYGKIGMIAHMHLVASWPNAPFLEVINDPPTADYRNFLKMFENPPSVDQFGQMRVPDEPGLGVNLDRDLIEETL